MLFSFDELQPHMVYRVAESPTATFPQDKRLVIINQSQEIEDFLQEVAKETAWLDLNTIDPVEYKDVIFDSEADYVMFDDDDLIVLFPSTPLPLIQSNQT